MKIGGFVSDMSHKGKNFQYKFVEWSCLEVIIPLPQDSDDESK